MELIHGSECHNVLEMHVQLVNVTGYHVHHDIEVRLTMFDFKYADASRSQAKFGHIWQIFPPLAYLGPYWGPTRIFQAST
jgi:hypothetical protein